MAEGTNVEEELGDLLFSAVNVSRFVKVDTEEALTGPPTSSSAASARWKRRPPAGRAWRA